MIQRIISAVREWISGHEKAVALILPWTLAVILLIYAYINLGRTFNWY